MKIGDSQFQIIQDRPYDDLKVSANIIRINHARLNIFTKWLRYNQFFEIITDAIKSNIVPNSTYQIIRKQYIRYICVY